MEITRRHAAVEDLVDNVILRGELAEDIQAAGLVLLPFVPMLVGVADQAMDLRRLRGPKDDEGGFVQ